ncbi:hypothetical protein Hanom_Chr02g00157131 [Helianthus anomalus]
MRLGLPSEGRMAFDTIDFLKPYAADIPQVRYFLLVVVVSNLYWLFMYIKNVLNLGSDQRVGPGTWRLTSLG